jgi:hypothetical protein
MHPPKKEKGISIKVVANREEEGEKEGKEEKEGQ